MVAPLDTDVIFTLVNDKTIDLTLAKTIDSTNNAFEQRAPSSKLAVCVAEMQTQGRGQLQRVWHSPVSENIYLSLCYFSSKPLAMLAPLSLAVGSTLCTWLNTHFLLKYPAKVKWPNDILCENAKLAGILIETKKITEKFRRVVIGIGLNVNMRSTPENTISQPWTSLCQLTDQSYDRNPICAQLINQLQTAIQIFENQHLEDISNA
jgi:BirA family biotin operon repressor/biotin-[acetyl-CoA-carboxylase] ligase